MRLDIRRLHARFALAGLLGVHIAGCQALLPLMWPPETSPGATNAARTPSAKLTLLVAWPARSGGDPRGYRAQVVPDSTATLKVTARQGTAVVATASAARQQGHASVTVDLTVPVSSDLGVTVEAIPGSNPPAATGGVIARGTATGISTIGSNSITVAVTLASLYVPTIAQVAAAGTGILTVTITGGNFQPAHAGQTKPTVTFARSGGGTISAPAEDVTVDSAFRLTVKVPSGATSGNLVVTQDGVGSSPFAAILPQPYGNGADGVLTVGAGSATTINSLSTAIVSAEAGQASLTVASSTGLAAGMRLLLHQTQGPDAGRWEMAEIASVPDAVSVNLADPLEGSYASSGNARAQAVAVPQYTDVSIAAGATLTAPAWDGATGGLLAFLASGTADIAGSVTMTGRGFRGKSHSCFYRCQPGFAGESHLGGGNPDSRNANGSGGGGGSQGQDCGMGAGGGYGSAGANGSSGTSGACNSGGPIPSAGGGATGAADLRTSLLFGGAGGEGGGDEDGSNPGAGGNGGGAIVIEARNFALAGAVSSAGGNGAGGNQGACGGWGCGMAGGGGGAGGAVLVMSDAAALGGNLVTAGGGTGGSCTCGSGGASGGVGRIAVRGAANGTTSPAYFAIP